MAEYWKSTPRYWCKQCKIYIRDTAFERTQHEASPKHQGNLKRFLRELHRGNERQQRESQNAKNEVERLKQIVVGGASSSSSTKDSNALPWKKEPSGIAPRPVSLEDRKRQMAQLAEMGVAIPEEFRAEMALAGEWQTVSERVIEPNGEGKPGSSAMVVGVRKRKRHDQEHDGEGNLEQDTESFVSKGWGSRFREYPGGQNDEDEDLDVLLASTKSLKKTKSSELGDGNAEEKGLSSTAADDLAATPSNQKDIKEETAFIPVHAKTTTAQQVDTEEAVSGIVFKKRKPKVVRR